MIQSVLSIPVLNKPLTCKICGMTYQRSSEQDQASHKRYHQTFVQGPLFDVGDEIPVKSTRILVAKKSVDSKIYCVRKDSAKMIRKTENILRMVNQELNAPEENPAWKSKIHEGIEGKAFIIIINKRVVGLCVTEPILDKEKQTRWMVHRTQEIVPKQINRNSKVGVSRIWVACNWRRRGLGLMMLDSVMKNSIYGMVLTKKEIAFSQPSYSGGLLASKFCGVKHKSGEMLVPIYLEDV